MRERLIAGGFAGLTGAAVQGIFESLAKAFELGDRVFIDFSQALFAHRLFEGVLAFIVGLLAHLILGLIFGIIFAYIIMVTSSNNYLLKGLVYGVVLWLLAAGVGLLVNLPGFREAPLNEALVTLSGTVVYGLITAYTLKIIDERTNII